MFVMIDLKVKPDKNDAVMSIRVHDTFFIVGKIEVLNLIFFERRRQESYKIYAIDFPIRILDMKPMEYRV
jgi:hypothetical protein